MKKHYYEWSKDRDYTKYNRKMQTCINNTMKMKAWFNLLQLKL